MNGLADTPAKSELLNMSHHNGEFGCPYCENPGEYIKTGKSGTRVYSSRLKYDQRDSKKVKDLSKEALKNDKKVFFLFLLFLFNFSLINIKTKKKR